VGFLKHLGNRAGRNLVSNQSEHGISKHINRGLVASRGVELFKFLAGVAVVKDAICPCLCRCVGFVHRVLNLV
jgi:hypothetical protein